jgi:hypothetical protein
MVIADVDVDLDLDLDVIIEIGGGPPGLFSFAVNSLSLVNGAITLAEKLGLVESDVDRVKRALDDLTAAVTRLRVELIKWLEDAELRELAASVLSTQDIVKVYFAGESTVTQHLLGKMITDFAYEDRILPANIDRCFARKDWHRALAYYSLWCSSISFRRLIKAHANRTGINAIEVAAIVDPSSSTAYRKKLRVSYQALTNGLWAGFKATKKSFKDRTARGGKILRVFGYYEFNKFVVASGPHPFNHQITADVAKAMCAAKRKRLTALRSEIFRKRLNPFSALSKEPSISFPRDNWQSLLTTRKKPMLFKWMRTAAGRR